MRTGSKHNGLWLSQKVSWSEPSCGAVPGSSAERDQFFWRGRVNGDGVIEVGLCCSHFHRNGKTLQHLITANALHVDPNHLGDGERRKMKPASSPSTGFPSVPHGLPCHLPVRGNLSAGPSSPLSRADDHLPFSQQYDVFLSKLTSATWLVLCHGSIPAAMQFFLREWTVI